MHISDLNAAMEDTFFKFSNCLYLLLLSEAEIEEQVRQLQAEEAIRQLGIVNQYAVT